MIDSVSISSNTNAPVERIGTRLCDCEKILYVPQYSVCIFSARICSEEKSPAMNKTRELRKTGLTYSDAKSLLTDSYCMVLLAPPFYISAPP